MSGLAFGLALKGIGGGLFRAGAGVFSFLGKVNWAKIWWTIPLAAAIIFALIERGEASHQRKLDQRDAAGWAAEKKFHAADLAAVRQKTADAQAADAAHAKAVETAQAQVTQQKVKDYESQIADLRRRYALVSLRGPAGPTAAGQGGSGAAPVPRLPSAPGGVNGAPAPGADAAFNCSANAVQLQALQDWLRGEAAIPR